MDHLHASADALAMTLAPSPPIQMAALDTALVGQPGSTKADVLVA